MARMKLDPNRPKYVMHSSDRSLSGQRGHRTQLRNKRASKKKAIAESRSALRAELDASPGMKILMSELDNIAWNEALQVSIKTIPRKFSALPEEMLRDFSREDVRADLMAHYVNEKYGIMQSPRKQNAAYITGMYNTRVKYLIRRYTDRRILQEKGAKHINSLHACAFQSEIGTWDPDTGEQIQQYLPAIKVSPQGNVDGK